MALIEIFSFRANNTDFFVKYFEGDSVVKVYDLSNAEVYGEAYQHEHVGNQLMIRLSDGSSKNFIGIAEYPYAQEEAITPPADGTHLRTQCYGYGLYNVVADGQGGERQGTLVEANSQQCGYVLPDGTYIRNECNGANLQQVVADGQGGERWGNVLEYNSASCGYVAPVYGCTDLEADNYNPEATHDDTSCTYAPKVFTEVKTIVVRPCTPGMYLRWLNSLGGVEGWLFTGKVSHPFSAEASGEYLLSSGLKGAAQKHGSTHMVLRTSGLNFNQYLALCEIYTSKLVWLHHDDKDPEQVYVLPATIDPEPGRKSYELTVELSLTPPNM